jgi:hypothetical protein
MDETRAKQRDNIPKNLPPKEYAKQIRNQCLPLNFSDRLLKHLAPLWEEGVTDWTPIQGKHTTPARHTQVHILNTKAMLANFRSGDQHRISNNMKLAMSTLRTTITPPSNQEHRKLPKPTTNKTQQIHTQWPQYINHEALPLAKPTTYETITTHISLERGTTKKQGATHAGDTYMTPSETILTSYDVIEIQDHIHLNNQTTYLVSQWSPEILTQEQISACTK